MKEKNSATPSRFQRPVHVDTSILSRHKSAQLDSQDPRNLQIPVTLSTLSTSCGIPECGNIFSIIAFGDGMIFPRGATSVMGAAMAMPQRESAVRSVVRFILSCLVMVLKTKWACVGLTTTYLEAAPTDGLDSWRKRREVRMLELVGIPGSYAIEGNIPYPWALERLSRLIPVVLLCFNLLDREEWGRVQLALRHPSSMDIQTALCFTLPSPPNYPQALVYCQFSLGLFNCRLLLKLRCVCCGLSICMPWDAIYARDDW